MKQLNNEYRLLYSELISKAKNRPFTNKDVVKASQKLDKHLNKVMKVKLGEHI